MKTKDKKLDLIRWLTEVEDEAILEQIAFLKRSDEENWSSLDEKERKAIAEGLQQLDNNEGIDHEHVINELKNKYSK